VILVDDIIDTAGTLCNAAQLMKESGANEIVAACTHPILSGQAVSRISDSALSKVFVLDTVPIPREKMCAKIQVLSSAELFGKAIDRIHREASISSLFFDKSSPVTL
jgi:ribose-phosphate pyrophosphokinase